jgi:hypothetical protein
MSVLSPAGWLAVTLVSVLALPPAQAPASATFGGGESYTLPAGAVAPKDLYVIASEATIDGTVEGDLAVIARRVTLTGTVKGNTNIVAARIEITGRTAGIVRTIGATQIIPPAPPAVPGAPLVPLPGAPFPAPTPGPAATAPPRPAATAPAANPAGLSLMSFGAVPVAGAAATAAPGGGLTSWWQTTGQLLLGFAVLSALLLWRAPGALTRPARALSAHPWRTLLLGLLVAQFSLIVPLATGVLVLATSVFWGWFPGVLLGVGLVAGFGLLWFLSPLVTGVWLGRRVGVLLGRGADSTPLLIAGVLVLALLGQLPTIGWMVYLVSFVLALGALIASAGGRAAPAPLPAAGAPVPAPAPLPATVTAAPASLPDAASVAPAPLPAAPPLPAALPAGTGTADAPPAG